MKKIQIIKLLTLVVAMVVPAAFAQVTGIVTPFVKGDGNSYGTDVYGAYGIETKGEYKILTELRWRLTKTEGDDTANFTHSYLRFTITDPKSIDLGGDWKIGWSYRYLPPTGSADQLAGSYGRVGFRPWVSRESESFDFMLRNISYIYLQRNGVQENTDASNPVPSVGNPIAALVFELIPTVKFAKSDSGNFYLLPYAAVGFTYVAAAPGGDTTWNNIFNIVPEFGYSFKTFANGANIAVYYDETANFGTDAVFELFQKEAYEVGVSWTQPF